MKWEINFTGECHIEAPTRKEAEQKFFNMTNGQWSEATNITFFDFDAVQEVKEEDSSAL